MTRQAAGFILVSRGPRAQKSGLGNKTIYINETRAHQKIESDADKAIKNRVKYRAQ